MGGLWVVVRCRCDRAISGLSAAHFNPDYRLRIPQALHFPAHRPASSRPPPHLPLGRKTAFLCVQVHHVLAVPYGEAAGVKSRLVTRTMPPFAHRAAATAALLLCPLSSAFVPALPSPHERRPSAVGRGLVATSTPVVAQTTSPACSTRPRAKRGLHATELGAAADRGGGGEECGDEGKGGEGKPPRSVLERPWDVEVDFHGERRVITVQPGDSILEAAEMSGMNLSYECRRGNCISCAARVQNGSSSHFENSADRIPEDGAPDGFVLTCSTHPTGPGVKLDLSANAEMWDAYCARLDDISTQDLLRQTSAEVMRKYRVEHPDYFREEVERQFK
ncbi:ferredoxin [Ectocarpus siliculosus]|uniref:Ferredoxin n=1 Tax=Ectocarpus siliculosus TaxID=2880 RepID=D7FRL9_ECTSI|nr:ferredoxin [Ectocarpus siliculosus]|eukprot:CBJ30810.1 ferredoxin [Ectocarpus siliculosus]